MSTAQKKLTILIVDDSGDIGRKLADALGGQLVDFSGSQPDSLDAEQVRATDASTPLVLQVASKDLDGSALARLLGGSAVDFTKVQSGAWRAELGDLGLSDSILRHDQLEALRDGVSVCRSVSTSRDRRVERGRAVFYLQTSDWCEWLEKDVGPRLEALLADLGPAEQGAVEGVSVVASEPAHLIADKHYVLVPEGRVLGPFDDHREAWLARCAWVYDKTQRPYCAELMTGEALAAFCGGRHGVLAEPAEIGGGHGPAARNH